MQRKYQSTQIYQKILYLLSIYIINNCWVIAHLLMTFRFVTLRKFVANNKYMGFLNVTKRNVMSN